MIAGAGRLVPERSTKYRRGSGPRLPSITWWSTEKAHRLNASGTAPGRPRQWCSALTVARSIRRSDPSVVGGVSRAITASRRTSARYPRTAAAASTHWARAACGSDQVGDAGGRPSADVPLVAGGGGSFPSPVGPPIAVPASVDSAAAARRRTAADRLPPVLAR